jgi:DNA-binding winged helix-turn-helix (wHTH) protein
MRFIFGDHMLDAARRELRRGGELIGVEPQVFDLLLHLLKNRDRVVSKDNLIETVWKGRAVSDATIDSRVKAARHAVGDSGAGQTVLRTLARKGVRFIAEAQEESMRAPAECAPVPALAHRPSIAVSRTCRETRARKTSWTARSKRSSARWRASTGFPSSPAI